MNALREQLHASYRLNKAGIDTRDPQFRRMMIHDAAIAGPASEFIQNVIDAARAYEPATQQMIFKAIGAEGEK